MNLFKNIEKLYNEIHNKTQNILCYDNKKSLSNKETIPNIKKTRKDVNEAKRRIKQLSESYEIMKKTVDPYVFFRRLNFSYDCILDLMTFKIKFSKNCTPENQYISLRNENEELVNSMIERSYNREIMQISKLQTNKAKLNRISKYFSNMEKAFENANKLWEGNYQFSTGYMCPHYTGALYTNANLQKLYSLKENVFNNINSLFGN